jgi:hypothetical protein
VYITGTWHLNNTGLHAPPVLVQKWPDSNWMLVQRWPDSNSEEKWDKASYLETCLHFYWLIKWTLITCKCNKIKNSFYHQNNENIYIFLWVTKTEIHTSECQVGAIIMSKLLPQGAPYIYYSLWGTGDTRLHKQSFQCTQYAHFNDCTIDAKTHVWPIDGIAQWLTNQRSLLGHIQAKHETFFDCLPVTKSIE